MDVMTKDQRSRCMSRIRSADTKPELRLRKALWSRGLRYRLRRKLPGRPDLAFVGASVVVFVDGCFWHACPQHGRTPGTNQGYWSPKLAGNAERDRRNTSALEQAGWTVMRFWEHDLADRFEQVVDEIERVVRSAE